MKPPKVLIYLPLNPFFQGLFLELLYLRFNSLILSIRTEKLLVCPLRSEEAFTNL